jgi:hypothetical protein
MSVNNSDFILIEGGQWQIDKRFDASLVYGIDVADVIEPGATVTNVTATLVDQLSGLTLGASASFVGTILKFRVGAGTVNTKPQVLVQWITDAGDTDARTLQFNLIAR